MKRLPQNMRVCSACHKKIDMRANVPGGDHGGATWLVPCRRCGEGTVLCHKCSCEATEKRLVGWVFTAKRIRALYRRFYTSTLHKQCWRI